MRMREIINTLASPQHPPPPSPHQRTTFETSAARTPYVILAYKKESNTQKHKEQVSHFLSVVLPSHFKSLKYRAPRCIFKSQVVFPPHANIREKGRILPLPFATSFFFHPSFVRGACARGLYDVRAVIPRRMTRACLRASINGNR